ncbi:MAG TPA: sulfite oxidase-like oxidoreductase [bacterium]|nr:sulfite oxidase-like oxidoreductase [bacterium]
MHKAKVGDDRLPPGQRLLRDKNDFPILDLGVQPDFDPETYRFSVTGEVEKPIELTYEELKKLPRTQLTADFHCVTKWSQYDIEWAGVKYLDLEKVVKPKPEANFVIQLGLDNYSTNVPIQDLRQDNVIVAYELRGEPIPREHGWPVRMIIPNLYGWKGSKFLHRLYFKEKDDPGFWETRGYNNHGDPWKEERYS